MLRYLYALNVLIMYIDTSTSQGKYTRHLLRESYREDGKVKHRTIANLSSCSDDEIKSIRLALKHKKDLTQLKSVSKDISLRQGLSVGAVWLIYDMAKQIGIVNALGNSRQGKLALWQVIARVTDQGSGLSAVRLAGSHAACDIIGLDSFNEEHLYKNLDWLCEMQETIEDSLFSRTHPDHRPNLFLYDVTSSYFEGMQNELSAFGYNRDGKKGKRQTVIGLLCDDKGKPLSIEVFPGNTQYPKTVASQIRKAAKRFGGDEVTSVGDRGMIKSNEIKDLSGHGFHYITAITKSQTESLIKKNTIQMSLFDRELAEITDKDGIRYVLRRNPIRAEEIQLSRESKLVSVRNEVIKQNKYLKDHPLAKQDVALRKVKERCGKLKVSKWILPSASERKIFLTLDEDALTEAAKLDGCYVLKTDLSQETASKTVIHSRYKDLAMVEWAFRTSKTAELEMRPVFVRLSGRTRGHAFV
ncbi:MAG: IS1634 family transposase [Desulfobacteraceae bacterium]|nr:IS1634 family transposase [Desulfobacteraceae bacterium]